MQNFEVRRELNIGHRQIIIGNINCVLIRWPD